MIAETRQDADIVVTPSIVHIRPSGSVPIYNLQFRKAPFWEKYEAYHYWHQNFDIHSPHETTNIIRNIAYIEARRAVEKGDVSEIYPHLRLRRVRTGRWAPDIESDQRLFTGLTYLFFHIAWLSLMLSIGICAIGYFYSGNWWGIASSGFFLVSIFMFQMCIGRARNEISR